MKEYLGWTKENLIAFEDEIINIYENKQMKPSPIHLCVGQEEPLIEIFNKFKITKKDWIFSTWRSSYVWLLSGRKPDELKKQIIKGHSMHIFGDKFFTSAIVAGISPIALGVAYAIKEKGSDERVFCFVGCGAKMCGLTTECVNYARGHDLPINFVVEWNNKCVNTNTSEVWGTRDTMDKVVGYKYTRKFMHAGTSLEGGPKKYVMW